MFRIKICGITTVQNAQAAAEAGADAVGLNFYAQSKRCVDVVRALRIADALPSHVVKVGLFVNADVKMISAVHQRIGFDLIQLHGDEPPEFLTRLCDAGLLNVPVMRAFPFAGDFTRLTESIDACRRLGCLPELALLDAAAPDKYGGGGVACDWNAAAAYHEIHSMPPLVLAGGLTPENVAAAIDIVRPAAVDVASGVESSPGIKSPALMRRFIAAANAAFEKLAADAS